MIFDYKEAQREYALCYSDKSRIRFIEQYFSTFNASKGKKTQFQCFPRQRVFLQTLAENRNVVAIKPRQCGITTLSSAYVAAQCVFASKESPETVLCVANKLDQANEIIMKVRDFLEQVPRWMWGTEYFSPDANSEKNLKSIFIKDARSELKLFNGCRIIARASSPNAARGISAVSLLVLDEAAFIEESVAVFTTAVATMASNPKSKIVMVSTPNGRDPLYYNTYRQALAHENNFVAVEFRWYQDPRFNHNLVWKRKNSETGEWEYDEDTIIDSDGSIKYDEERWRNLEHKGWKPSAPWYSEMCLSFNNDSIKIAQELDVSFMGSSDNVVAAEFIEMQETLNVREPLEDFKDPLVEETWFWKKPIDGHRYILSCLPQGEKVLTNRGLVSVEDINDDDLLVTKEGEYTRIKTSMVREVKDEEVVEVKLCNFIDSVRFTWNHPIWSSIGKKIHWYKDKTTNKRYRKSIYDFKFNNSNLLDKDSWVEIPNFYKLNELSDEEILRKWDKFECTFNNQYKPIANPLLNEDFWWYCGMWLAEGFINGNQIITCHHIDEEDYHSKISVICETVLERKASKTLRENEHGARMTVCCSQLANFLYDTFGYHACGKRIPEWVKMLPEKYKIRLVEGYLDGDGCYQKDSIVAASISKELINGLQDILLSLGILCSATKKYDEHYEMWGDREVLKKAEYLLMIGKGSLVTIFEKLGRPILERPKKVFKNGNISFSDDLSTIYIRVSKVEKYEYSGKVYNFETESNSHTFCCRGIATHNCDASRGTAADSTAIEIIDMDGRDDDGLPIIEQVAEYVGKKLGDDIGAICYQYATMYNDAFVVFDATGGQSDAAIITMLQMGYKNLYYEDSNQKTYLVQRSTKNYDSYTDKLPGFHFQGNRYPVLSNFAGLVRNNEFKIRSMRVINELNTWIFKGETGRIDHMEGSHDDTLTSLAMGLFVMQYSVNRIQHTIDKDKAILSSFIVGGGIPTHHSKLSNGGVVSPRSGLPFYTQKSFPKNNIINGNFMWVFGGSK